VVDFGEYIPYNHLVPRRLAGTQGLHHPGLAQVGRDLRRCPTAEALEAGRPTAGDVWTSPHAGYPPFGAAVTTLGTPTARQRSEPLKPVRQAASGRFKGRKLSYPHLERQLRQAIALVQPAHWSAKLTTGRAFCIPQHRSSTLWGWTNRDECRLL